MIPLEDPTGHDPLTVQCPDCEAPPGVPCRTDYADGHVTRVAIARLRAVEHGVCALCLRPMVRATQPDETWHHITEDADRCPVIPDPKVNWDAYATAVNLGLTPGHPGPEHFAALTTCPECTAGKCVNCEGLSWVDPIDGLADCLCHLTGHPSQVVTDPNAPRPAHSDPMRAPKL